MGPPLINSPSGKESPARSGHSLAAGLSCFRCKKSIPQRDVGTQLLCECGGPLLQKYELGRLTKGDRESLRSRPWGLWRYREVLPIMDSARIVSLSEGGTPLIALDTTGAAVGIRNLVVKDEGRNPTGTFKARGAS